MKKIALLILLLFITNVSFSQSIFGKWNSFDEETNKVESVIEVYQKDGKAFAKVVDIKDDPEESCQFRAMRALNVVCTRAQQRAFEKGDGKVFLKSMDERHICILMCIAWNAPFVGFC